ncbi:MAG: hypothetical protein LQ352_004008 [Teloschistes flavicans]|nr:MAG: hypothetical protein LQ352_004008 [Teloschistes flavicans]
MVSLTFVLACVGLCHALPAQSELPQNEGNLWPFVETLSGSTTAADNSTEVTVPIPQLRGLSFQTNWGYFDLPRRGVEFAADLVSAIFQTWQKNNNDPLVNIVDKRMIPFFSWEIRLTPRFYPRLPKLLTPQKIGVAMYVVFREVIRLDQWPGYAKVKIFEGDPLPPPQTNQIGTLEFHNKPVREDTISAGNLTVLGDLPYAQRWLGCFNKAMAPALPKNPKSLVTQDPRFPPQPGPVKWSQQCGNPGWADRLDIFIYPTANPGSRLELTWLEYFNTIQDWLARTAKGMDTGRFVQIIKEGNKLVAEIAIFIQKGPGSEQPGIATS